MDFKTGRIITSRSKAVGVIRILIEIVCLFTMTAISVPVFLLVILARPFKLIRFGTLNSSAIGHFAGDTENYLCMRDLRMIPRNTIDIFFHERVSNYQLLKMWKRVLIVHSIGKYLYRLTFYFPGGDKHRIKTTNFETDMLGLFAKTKVHLYFTKEEKKQAYQDLSKMHISKNDVYICLLGRDPAYKKKVKPFHDWSYHNYRNVDIKSYLLAAEAFANKGYYVIRMGSEVETIMPTNNPRIIEYAHRGFRTELLDIYLPANCYFFIGCGSGLDSVADVFRKPIVYVNYIPIEHVNSWNPKAITIFKKYWLKDEKRLMRFDEIIESGAGVFKTSQEYEKRGIEIIDNSPEEIFHACDEMDQRLRGVWIEKEEDEILQQRFWALIKKKYPERACLSRIGSQFLRSNRELLS